MRILPAGEDPGQEAAFLHRSAGGSFFFVDLPLPSPPACTLDVKRGNRTNLACGIAADVLEYELLPRTARIRRSIDRAQDQGVLAHVCHGEASCGRGRAVSRWWSDKFWIICE